MSEHALFERIEAVRPHLPGWCSADKARKLATVILDQRPAVCVEIGVFGGSSLIPQALALQHLGQGTAYGIDPWSTSAALEEMREQVNLDWWSAVDLDATYRQCRDRLAQLGLDGCCTLIRARAADVVERFADQSIGLLHIDGNHSEVLSMLDVQHYLPKVVPGGHVFFDDVSWAEQGAVTTHRALSYLRQNGCALVDQTGDCAILRKAAGAKVGCAFFT